jgi:hypothetical protein
MNMTTPHRAITMYWYRLTGRESMKSGSVTRDGAKDMIASHYLMPGCPDDVVVVADHAVTTGSPDGTKASQ